MTEERVTKNIIKWLEKNGWVILCFDFPQSGTGHQIHLNKYLRETKNKGSFIPDIVAYRNQLVVFFENKDRFAMSDFDKIQNLKENNEYSEGINKLLENDGSKIMYFGVCMPLSKNNERKSDLNKTKVDFVIFIDELSNVKIYYQKSNIF